MRINAEKSVLVPSGRGAALRGADIRWSAAAAADASASSVDSGRSAADPPVRRRAHPRVLAQGGGGATQEFKQGPGSDLVT